jgi:hypothetical protein
MRNMRNIKFLIILSLIGFASNVNGQSTLGSLSASADAYAQLLIPMTIAVGATSLNFGTIIQTSGTAEGTVVMPATADAIVYTNLFAATTLVGIIAPTRGSFNVTGTQNESYAVVLPATITLTNTTSVALSETLTVSALFSSFAGAAHSLTSTLSTTGTGSFTVGGTLTIPQDSMGGSYTGTYDVTVDYN